ncbi:outer membrane efflux protein [Ditylenchus destructor]|nr:outer membrane efflux protein [Ditylenchus destructor]
MRLPFPSARMRSLPLLTAVALICAGCCFPPPRAPRTARDLRPGPRRRPRARRRARAARPAGELAVQPARHCCRSGARSSRSCATRTTARASTRPRRPSRTSTASRSRSAIALEAQLSAALDVEQARAYYELARGNTAQVREELADARQALAQITGRMPGELRPLAPELAMLMPDPADPQPGVGLDGQRLAGNAVAPQDAGRYNSTIGLKLTIPIFAGGAVESQKRQAIYQREQLREDLEGSRRAMTRETQAQYQAVLSALSQMRTAGAAVQAAEKALASPRSGLDLGLRTMTDLLLAIQTQSNARNAWEQARHRYVLSKLLLQQAAGALAEPQLAAVNTLLVLPASTSKH